VKSTHGLPFIFVLIIGLSVVVRMAAPVSPAQAGDTPPQARSNERAETPIQQLDSDGVSLEAVQARLDKKSAGLHIMLQFHGEPAGLIYARHRSSAGIQSATNLAAAQIERIESVQDVALSAIQRNAPGAQVLYTTQRVYNGIAMLVDPADLPTLSRLPGLKAIQPLPLHEPGHTSSVPLIGAAEVWMSPFSYRPGHQNRHHRHRHRLPAQDLLRRSIPLCHKSSDHHWRHPRVFPRRHQSCGGLRFCRR